MSRLPATFVEYREPFVGGGGIFFAIPPYKANTVRERWINDINEGLIEFYTAMIERPEEFIAKCREIEPMKEGEPVAVSREGSDPNSKKYNARLKTKFDELKYNDKCDQALRYFFINRTVWAGRVTYDPEMESRMYYSNPQGWNIVKKDHLERVAEWLKGTKVTKGDYRVLLEAPGDDVVIYLDPPYVVDTGHVSSDKLYEFGFSDQDHKDFAAAIKKCKHKVCISYDDDPLVRELFKEDDGFYLKEETWAYSGTTKEKKDIGRELIITNYEIEPKDSLKTVLFPPKKDKIEEPQIQ